MHHHACGELPQYTQPPSFGGWRFPFDALIANCYGHPINLHPFKTEHPRLILPLNPALQLQPSTTLLPVAPARFPKSKPKPIGTMKFTQVFVQKFSVPRRIEETKTPVFLGEINHGLQIKSLLTCLKAHERKTRLK